MRPVAVPVVSVFLLASSLVTGADAAAPPLISAERRAQEAGIDLGSVIEMVQHHVGAGADGVLRAEDPLYVLELAPSGFSLALGEASRFGVATRSVGGRRAAGAAPWLAELNSATREIAPAVTERVTAREGEVEWDFVLHRPPPGRGDLRIEAGVDAGGPAEVLGDSLRWPGVRMGELVAIDAGGRELHRALPLPTRGGVALEVPAAVLAGARYPITLDPVVSPEHDPSDPVQGAASNAEYSPAVAWGGTSFLVVWGDQRRDNGDIRGARVNASGGVLDAQGIPISTQPGAQNEPSVAFNGTSFLVAWEDFQSQKIRGARVSTAGEVFSEIQISTAPYFQSDPAVASDGANFLVVWDELRADYHIYGTRVSGAGQVQDQYPSPIAVSTAALNQVDPAVGWNGTNYLVVWTDARNPSADIFGARVTGGVAQDSGGFAITTAAGGQVGPQVAWNGSTFLVVWTHLGNSPDVRGARVTGPGPEPPQIVISAGTHSEEFPSVASDGSNFLVAWEDNRLGNDRVYAARVRGSDGAVLDLSGIEITSTNSAAPALAWNGTHYFAVWPDFRTFGNDIYGARVSLSGAVQDTTGILIAKASNAQCCPAVGFDGTNFFVVWIDSRGGDVYGARVSGTGTILDGAGIPIATTSEDLGLPSLAFNGTSYLVVWDNDLTQIYGARVRAADGALQDSSPIPIRTLGEHRAPSVASDGANFLVVWEEFGPNGNFDIYGTRVTGSGVVQDPSGIVVSGALAEQYRPAVAWSGASYLVVWQQGSVTPDIYGARVTSAGGVLDIAGIQISIAAGSQTAPALAWSGSSFLVAWTDLRGANADVWGARLDDMGAVQGIEIQISAAANDQQRVDLAWNGANFLVVWEDYRSSPSTSDIFGARVTAGGGVIDLGGLAIANSTESERFPHAVGAQMGRVGVSYDRFVGDPPYSARRARLRFVDEPAHDNFAAAQVIAGPAGRVTGINVGASKELGEPNHAANPGGASVWYRWTAPATGGVTIDTLTSGFDTLLAAYTGNSVSALTEVASNNDIGGGNLQSRVFFRTTEGTLYRIAVDGAGSANGPLVLNWSLDSTAPVAPVIAQPAEGAIFNNASVAVSGTAEAGSTVRVYEGATLRATVTADGGGSWSSTISFAEGSHTIGASATDAAGNTGPASALRAFTVDLTAPAAPAVTQPAQDASLPSSTVTVSGTAEAGSTVRVYEVGTLKATVTADGLGAWSANISFPEGAHRITATATDAAGNTGPASDARDFTVDLTRPESPVITGPGQNAFLDSAGVVVSGTTEARASVRVYEGATLRATVAAGDSGAWSVTITFTEGAHTITATATDAAGNVSPPSQSRTFTVDLTAPPAPTINQPGAGALLNSSSVVVSGTAEGGTSVRVLEGAAVRATATADGAGAWSATVTFTDGAHAITADATDQAGNRGVPSPSRSFTVDTTPPAAPVVNQPAEGALFNAAQTSVNVVGTAEPGSKVEVFEGAVLKGTTTATSFGGWSVLITFPHGSHTITARATDAATNQGPASATRTFTVDAQPPPAPVISLPAPEAALASPNVTVSGTAEANATVNVYEGAELKASPRADAGGAWSVVATFAEGRRTITANATDAAGNTGGSSASRSFVVDLTPPETVIDGGPTGTQSVSSATFTFSSNEQGTFSCKLDAQPFADCASPHPLANLAEGSHTFQVRAADQAGNVDPTPATRTWIVDTPPETTITSGPGPFTSSSSATFTFSSSQDPQTATFGCRLDGGAFDGCTSPKTYGNLQAGEHIFEVRATDANGNTDPSPAQRTWIYDSSGAAVEIRRPVSGVYNQDQLVAPVPGAPFAVVVGAIRVRAQAADLQSSISIVCFFVDDDVSPSTCSDTPVPGTDEYEFRYVPRTALHTVRAEATNGAQIRSSASVSILGA